MGAPFRVARALGELVLALRGWGIVEWYAVSTDVGCAVWFRFQDLVVYLDLIPASPIHESTQSISGAGAQEETVQGGGEAMAPAVESI